jgi:hypothetical protein
MVIPVEHGGPILKEPVPEFHQEGLFHELLHFAAKDEEGEHQCYGCKIQRRG